MFKYELYKSKDEYNNKPKYDFNQNYTLTEENNKHVFEFDPIKKSGANLNNSEIFIRKVTLENKIANETFDTYAKIESKYEIIKGDKTDKDGKIRITTNKITEPNCTFSILIDIPDENEKFVIFNLVEKQPEPDPTSSTEPEPTSSTEPEPTSSTEPDPTSSTEPEPTTTTEPDPSSSSETDPKQSGDKSLVIKIAVPIACVVFVIIVVVVIIMIRKRRRNTLQGSFLRPL
jgi:cytoskeletal protein RodZ